MNSSSRQIAGASLVETLMSVFLVSCIGTVLASAMPMATVGRTRAKNSLRATNFAQKQIELIRAEGYPNITADKLAAVGVIDNTTTVSTNTYSCNNTDAAVGDDIADVVPNGEATVKIEQADLELKRVTVRVTWSDRGATRSYEVGTLVANL